MAANEGWYSEWFANGWFPSVWFAPADESAVPPEELSVGYISGGGGGGKLSRAIAGRKQRRPGQFGRQDRPRAHPEYDVDYDQFKEKVLEPVEFEADDEEVLMLLVQMVGEL